MTYPLYGKPMGKGNLKPPKVASGDNYGIGVKQPVGKSRSGAVGYLPVTSKKLKTPPTKVV